MILDIFLWYLAILLAGWLAFPLAFLLLPYLPDRAYAFIKPLGLLLWGYAYWLLASVGIIQNDIGGVVFGLIVLAALSGWALWRTGWRELWSWVTDHGKLILVSEALFLLAFLAWAVVRGAYPDISGTEKPMEMAFINAILHSPTFPPHDPWLSGYAISYYYFGYVIVAMLARFTSIPGEISFNLAVASWFALTATAAFGLLYDLLAARGQDFLRNLKEQAFALAGGLLAPLFLLLVSNLEGLLEVLHARGLFWQNSNGTWTSSFWSWLNIQELVSPPSLPFTWVPNRAGGIWWWRASRVLQDFDFKGQSREIIDEFPFFSYLLGDLHPHVLSMPFVLLAIGLALNLFLKMLAQPLGFQFERWFRRADTWLAVIALGGLAFLNTWDFPVYLALFGAAFFLAHYLREGWQWQRVVDVVFLLFSMGAAGVLLYLPFYIGFQSQAGGILPSLIFETRGVFFWIMFGSLLLPVFAWLIFQGWKNRSLVDLKNATIFAVGVTGGLWALSFLFGAAVLPRYLGIYNADPNSPVLAEALMRRLAQPGTWLTLLLILWLTWALLAAMRKRQAASIDTLSTMGEPVEPAVLPEVHTDSFVLLLILLGAGLTLFPEFFYLRDQFGWRMNTIFKFYFQAWMVWSLAAGYGSAILWKELRGAVTWVWAAAWTILIAAALIYPVFGLSDRTGLSVDASRFQADAWTLDGASYLKKYSPDDWQGIQWLSQAPLGVVAEAVGGSYSAYARVSTFSGQPAVLGWPGHESQWRGSAVEIGSREPDMELLFRDANWLQVQQIIQKYHIRYIYVGPMERGKYRVNDKNFQQNLTVVYQNEQVTIYEVPAYPLNGNTIQ